MKKNEQTTLKTLDCDPEWISMQKESMRQNLQEQQQNIKKCAITQENTIRDLRIENARRNVQLLHMMVMQIHEKSGENKWSDIYAAAISVLMLNLKILKETETIK